MSAGSSKLGRRARRAAAAEPAGGAQRALAGDDGGDRLELEALDPDPEVRCVVIAGSDEVFAAGADIKAMSERSFAEALYHPAAGFWKRLAAIRTPMVAAVSG